MATSASGDLRVTKETMRTSSGRTVGAPGFGPRSSSRHSRRPTQRRTVNEKATQRSLQDDLERVEKMRVEEELTRAFHMIDENGDGQLSLQELKRAFPRAGQEYLNYIDTDCDGYISRDEFVREFMANAQRHGDPDKLEYTDFRTHFMDGFEKNMQYVAAQEPEDTPEHETSAAPPEFDKSKMLVHAFPPTRAPRRKIPNREPPSPSSHRPQESQHHPQESQHHPRESQHHPRESQHHPRESQHHPRESQQHPSQLRRADHATVQTYRKKKHELDKLEDERKIHVQERNYTQSTLTQDRVQEMRLELLGLLITGMEQLKQQMLVLKEQQRYSEAGQTQARIKATQTEHDQVQNLYDTTKQRLDTYYD